MSVPVRSLLANRRLAVARGELTRMWPGAAWDLATLVWWRGLWGPIRARLRGPSPDALYHSTTGGCPLCNPSTPVDQLGDKEGHRG